MDLIALAALKNQNEIVETFFESYISDAWYQTSSKCIMFPSHTDWFKLSTFEKLWTITGQIDLKLFLHVFRASRSRRKNLSLFTRKRTLKFLTFSVCKGNTAIYLMLPIYASFEEIDAMRAFLQQLEGNNRGVVFYMNPSTFWQKSSALPRIRFWQILKQHLEGGKNEIVEIKYDPIFVYANKFPLEDYNEFVKRKTKSH